MKGKSVPIPLLSVILLLFTPLPALAVDGTVTGVAAEPPLAFVGDEVVAEILGTEVCDKLQVDFGDGSPPIEMQKVEFKNDKNTTSPPHAYGGAGLYTVTITPVEKCNGQAQAAVEIKEKVDVAILKDRLCEVLDNCASDAGEGASGGGSGQKKEIVDAMRARLPHIETMFPGPVKPGADVLVLGKNFGDNTTQLRMRIKQSNKTFVLDRIDSSPTFFAATIPATISGVPDQPAEFFLVMGSGMESNKFQATFTAAREVKMIPMGDVKVVSCSTASNCDWCNNHQDSDDAGDYCDIKIGCNHSACGRSYNNWGAVGTDSGDDVYEVNLKNGWVCDSAGPLGMNVDSGEGGAGGPHDFNAGGSACKFWVGWWVTPADTITYWVPVYIKGPKGISYK